MTGPSKTVASTTAPHQTPPRETPPRETPPRETTQVGTASSKTSYGLRALHSLTGVVPVGVFMLLQLWAHAKVLDGPSAYRAALTAVHPTSWAIRILVLAPLLFHVGYGLVLTFRPQYNVGRYPLSRNWTYTLQRITGVLALGLILLTLALFWNDAPEHLPERIVGTVSQTHAGLPLIALGYVIGLAACAFHFAVGLWMIGVRYGWLSTRGTQAQAGMAFTVSGVALFAWGAHTLVFMATGWTPIEGSTTVERNAVCDPATVQLPPPASSSAVVEKYPKAPNPKAPKK